MCGISGIVNFSYHQDQLPLLLEPLKKMVEVQHHRGPDYQEIYIGKQGKVGLGHNRLSILDLSSAGNQPMSNTSGSLQLVFNGELYNYLELKQTLQASYTFRTDTDTEVVLAAYEQWGIACLDRFIGMFAFAIWDIEKQELFAARDRFGVKPFFYTYLDGELRFSSEIKALHASGIHRTPAPATWATYLSTGRYDHEEQTFWQSVHRLMPGQYLTLNSASGLSIKSWYDIAERVIKDGPDPRSLSEVGTELESLLHETINLRFRADVPVGVCLSGGFDSSILAGLVGHKFAQQHLPHAFTFYCNDERYDELPWVEALLEQVPLRPNFCLLTPEEIPDLAQQVSYYQDEPFGGFPTLGMVKVYKQARELGITVLLDGNGLDEGWAGYEYYQRHQTVNMAQAPVQGARQNTTLANCLIPEFASTQTEFNFHKPFEDSLLNLQYRDISMTKIPRAMRFADRASMMYSIELREPFLDHRILELGLRQPEHYKIKDGQGKWLPRQVAGTLLPNKVKEAPKRPLQTPQREWLKHEVSSWADDCIDKALNAYGNEWLDREKVQQLWKAYRETDFDNSFFIWQCVSLGLLV